ncbi:aspartate--tRNA ligase [Buchnera aphidicola]|uniref:aspartate--tRNA ligase n=1 Tax=Buchnera aphidicola TaxID=9 RepID=UPI003D18E461
MRTKYCGNITVSDVNQTVTLCGWVDRKRNFGNFIFVDIRDCTGTVQIFFHSKNHAAFQNALKLRNEFCIQVIGIVQKRTVKNQNMKIKTGLVEIVANVLNIINSAISLPMDINQHNEEKIRFKYRYLDLRRVDMFQNLKSRHEITKYIRNFLNKHDFLDLETPLLSKSTPEGAKEYFISSRMHQNKYYALPQSPQIFKQLLMISGIDKYYQIVKCFRDEDLRSDRQPEFTQIDIEAAFINDIYIKHITESIIKMLWKKFLNYTLTDIPSITFSDAINKYGSDKPDLRNPIQLYHIKKSNLVYNTNSSNENNIITIALVIPMGISKFSECEIYNINKIIDVYNTINYVYIYVYNLKNQEYKIINTINPLKTHNTIEIIDNINANNGDIILILSGKKDVVNNLSNQVKNIIAQKLDLIDQNSWKPIWITDFPMFKKDKNNVLSATHHPFTAPKNIDIQTLTTINPESILSNAYDLVINGYEVGGGSVRIHNPEVQKIIFDILNISIKTNKHPFDFFVHALKYGTPPHAGIALGLDRIVMLLTKNNNIKDVIAFPKTNTATCLMSGTPSTIIY